MLENGIVVKQKFDVLEAMTGCETANKYYVHEMNKEGGLNRKRIFKCKEKSGWCARNCLAATGRGWTIARRASDGVILRNTESVAGSYGSAGC